MGSPPFFNRWSLFTFKSGVVKEDRVLFLILKIVHLIAISFSMIGFITSVVLSIVKYYSTPISIDCFHVFISFIIGIVIVFSAIFAIWLVKGIFPVDKSKILVFANRCLLILFFTSPAILPFLGATIYY